MVCNFVGDFFPAPGGFTCYLSNVFGASTDFIFPGIPSIGGSLDLSFAWDFAHIVEFLSFICLVFAAFWTLDPSITSYSQTFRSFDVGLGLGFMPTYKHVSILYV